MVLATLVEKYVSIVSTSKANLTNGFLKSKSYKLEAPKNVIN